MAKSFGNKRSTTSNPKDENREIRKAGNNDNIFGTNIVDSINGYAEAFSSSISSALLGKQVSYNQLISSFNSNKISILNCLDKLRQDSTYIYDKIKNGNLTIKTDSSHNYTLFYEKLDLIANTLSNLPIKDNSNITTIIPEQKENEINNTISYKEDLENILDTLKSKFDDEDKNHVKSLFTDISSIRESIFSIMDSFEEDRANSNTETLLSSIIDSLSTIQENSNKLEFIFNTKDSKNFDKIIEQLSKLSPEGIKNIERLGSMLVKINNLNFSNISDFIFALNLFTELKVKKVNKVIESINNGLIYNLQITFDELNQLPKIPASVSKSISTFTDIYFSIIGVTNLKDIIKARIALWQLSKLFGDEKSKDSLISVIQEINKFPKLTQNTEKSITSIEKIFSILSIIGNTSFTRAKRNISHIKGAIESLIKEIQKIEIGDFDAESTIEPVSKVLDLIEDKIFNRLNNLANEVDAANENIYKISDVIKKTKYIALSTRDIDEKDLEEAENSTTSLIKSVSLMGFLMTVGGMILSSNERLVMGSLRFGAIFGIFLLELSIPIAILGLIAVYIQKGEDQHWLDITSDFIMKAGILLVLSSLIFLIPKITLASIGFAKVFAQFLIALTIPIAIASLISRSDALGTLDDVSIYITRVMFVLTLGSMIMLYRNGIIYKNALKFGGILALFIAETLLPFILYSWLVKESVYQVEAFTTFIVVCSAVMTLGALIASNTKLMKNALKFGLYLSGFILFSIAPFILFRKFENDLGNTIVSIKNLIIASALVMMVGALFAQNRRLVQGAKRFTKLMFFFILGTVSPFLLFGPTAVKLFATVKTLLIFVTVSTALLMLGGYIIIKRPEIAIGALAFTLLLHLFLAGLLRPFKNINIGNVLGAGVVMSALSTLLLTITVALAINTFIYHKFKNDAIGGLVLTTVTVGLILGIVFVLTRDSIQKDIILGLKNTVLISALLLAIIGVIYLTSLLIPDPVKTLYQMGIAFATMGLLIGFAFILSKIEQKLVLKSIYTIAMLSGMILAIGVSLYLIAKSDADWKHFGLLALMTVIIIGEVALVYFISKAIKTNEVINAIGIIGAMSIAMLAIGVSLAIIAMSGADWRHFGLLALMSIIIFGEAIALTWLVKSIKLDDILGAISIIGAMSIALIAISGALYIISQSNADWKHVWMLSVMMAVVGVFGILISKIGEISIKDALLGIAIIGVSTLIIFGLSNAIVAIAQSKADWKHVGMVGALSAIVLAMSGLMILIGTAISNPIGAIAAAAGVAFIGSVTAIIMGLSSALLKVAEASEVLEKIRHPERITSTLNAVIKSFSNLDLKNSKKMIKDAKALKKALNALVPSLSLASALILDISNMKVATGYNEKGKALGYRKIDTKDFENASEGIQKIIITISDAISKAGTNLSKISKKRDFNRALTFSREIGPIISSIASGLRQYATLKFPNSWDENGKPNGFIELNENAFENAAKNIVKVITVLGGTIASIASGKSNTEIDLGELGKISIKDFHDAMAGRNKKFQRVLDYSTDLGKVISKLASGLSSFAKGKFARYDENGKVIGYDTLKDLIDNGNLVTNISTVITGLSTAIMSVYKDNKDMFQTNLFEFGKGENGIFGLKINGKGTPIQKVINFSYTLSSILVNLAKGLKGMAELKFAKYDKDGNVTGYVTIVGEDDFKKVGTNIGNIISAMANGVLEANIFKEGNKIKDIERKIASLAPLGNLVKDIADGLVSYSKLIIPQYDKDGKIISNTKLSPNDLKEAATNIRDIISTISKGIIDVFQDERGKSIVKPDKLKLMIESISGVTGLIKNTAQAINTFAEGGIPEYGVDGKIIGRTPFSIEDINRYQEVIERIVLSGFEVIENIKTKYSSYFDGNLDLDEILETVIKPTELIKKCAELIKFVSEYNIPDYKDGKLVGKIKLNEDKINSIIPIIETLISSVPNAIMNGFNSIEYKDINNYISLSSIIEATSNLISQINEDIISLLFNNISIPETVFTGTRLSTKVEGESSEISAMPPVLIDLYYLTFGIYKMYSLISDLSEEKIKRRNLNRIMDILPEVESFIISITSYDLSKLASSLSSISNKVLESLTSKEESGKIEKLILFYSELFNDVSFISNRRINIPKEFLSNLATISSLTNSLINYTNQILSLGIDDNYTVYVIGKLYDVDRLFKSVDNSIYNISTILKNSINFEDNVNNLNNFKNYILSIFDTFIELTSSLDSIDIDIFGSKVIPLLNGIGDTISILKKTFLEKENKDRSPYAISISNMIGNNREMNSLKEKAIDFSDSMVILTKMSLIAAGAKSDGFDIIAEGYEKINESASNFTFENASKLRSNAEVLDKYVKAVNKLDENKLYKLNDLLETMNRLAINLGNIDKFTEVLSTKLSETLESLSENIYSAEETISKADNLQKERAKAIQESIDKVKEIMDKPLRVGVKNLKDGDTVESVWENPKDNKTL